MNVPTNPKITSYGGEGGGGGVNVNLNEIWRG